jgi:CBS domain-containing protein
MRAKDIMTKDVVIIAPDASIADAAKLMLRWRISGIPVVNKLGKLIGIITEGDLIRRAEFQLPSQITSAQSQEQDEKANIGAHGVKVEDVMTKEVLTVDENETQEQIAMTLEERGIKRVPVMHGDRITGIVSRANLLRSLATEKTGATNPSDSQIKSTIITTAEADAALRLSLVDVMVKDSIVHLWGNVGSEAERNAISVIAENTSGVKEVKNHLRVLPQSNFDYKPE